MAIVRQFEDIPRRKGTTKSSTKKSMYAKVRKRCEVCGIPFFTSYSFSVFCKDHSVKKN